MNGAAPIDSGQAFAADLRKIREARGISIEQLHDETKIPRGLIDSFEQSGLVDHPMFNRVYLRSFVRTYAEVVGISPEVVLEALDEALDERYTNQLAIAYLGVEPPAAPDTEDLAESDEDVETSFEEDETVEEMEPAPVDDLEEDEDEVEVVEEEIQPVKTAPVPPPIVPLENEPPAESARPVENRLRPAGGVATSVPRKTMSRRPHEEERSRQWIWIVGAVLLLGLVAWFVFSRMGVPEPETTVTAETTEGGAPEPEAEAPAPLPPVEIGDSLDVNIIAAGGPVQDIKVTVDDDLRRPYWIEVGESRLFQAAERMVIEQELDVIQLELEGHSYPTDVRDDQGRIVITRQSAEQFLNQGR